jgi:hypothetical protein
MEQGYIQLDRADQELDFWPRGVFTKFEAWVDLQFMARFSDEPKKMMDSKGEFTLEKGDLLASGRYLSKRWEWSTKKVWNFIDANERGGLIRVKERNAKRTILTVVKISLCSDEGNAESDTKETQKKRKRNAKETNNKKGTTEEGKNVKESFALFWESYPKKMAKAQAQKSFDKILKDGTNLEDILKGLELSKKSEQWQKDNGQFIPYPATWLNQGRWEDEHSTEIQEPRIPFEKFATIINESRRHYQSNETPNFKDPTILKALQAYGWPALRDSTTEKLKEIYQNERV